MKKTNHLNTPLTIVCLEKEYFKLNHNFYTNQDHRSFNVPTNVVDKNDINHQLS